MLQVVMSTSSGLKRQLGAAMGAEAAASLAARSEVRRITLHESKLGRAFAEPSDKRRAAPLQCCQDQSQQDDDYNDRGHGASFTFSLPPTSRSSQSCLCFG